LAESAANVANSLTADPESQALWWARTLARQCREALDELTFLVPWISLSTAPNKLSEFPGFDRIPTLRELARLDLKRLPAIGDTLASEAGSDESEWIDEIRGLITEAAWRAKARIVEIENLALRSGELADMEYDFLFDKGNHLLAIGYNVSERRRDSSYYDLLASEARFCSFVGIAQGQLPQENWFALGRLLTGAGGQPVLLSWSGSMFEYLMPLLVMPTHDNTLLDQTYKEAVERQIEYGKKRGVPWGISESGYNAIDVHLNYQYRAFGVPSLGLKRGLAEDLVIAPYASALALMVASPIGPGRAHALFG
jgi:cyclic beta-1,2-glucan synthetase